jgi:hypothetical protein
VVYPHKGLRTHDEPRAPSKHTYRGMAEALSHSGDLKET